MAVTGGKVMQLKVKKGNEKIDLGNIVYTENRISDNHIENSLYDVYGSPSVYKQCAWNEIESNCKVVGGHGLTVTGYNCNFFSTAFSVCLCGKLYKIVDTPSNRYAYTNDKRFDFKGISVRIYGCRNKWIRDNIRNLVKPYLKAIGVKKARVDYIGFNDGGYKFLVNRCNMNDIEIENFNQEYYKTTVNL